MTSGRPAAAETHGSESALRTRTKILDGALHAIGRYGLAKLGMSDVSESAGVSRGTVYRYFPNRESLLEDLASHVVTRFRGELKDSLSGPGAADDRLLASLRHVTCQVANTAAIRRLIETEPAFVLSYVGQQEPMIRSMVEDLVAPVLAGLPGPRVGRAHHSDAIEWMTRALVSAVLFPAVDGEALARSLARLFRVLLIAPGAAGTSP